MKRIAVTFVVMIFGGTVFAQQHNMVVFSNHDETKRDTIKIGNYVTVDLVNEKRNYGIIKDITSGYFVVENDTVKTENVSKIYFLRHNPHKAGKIMMISGGAFLGGGIVFILFNSHDFGASLAGAGSVVVGTIVLVTGAIVHSKETKVKRLIGRSWGLKIV